MTEPHPLGWFALHDEDEGHPDGWQPALQLSGLQFTFDVWFPSEQACLDWIRAEVLHKDMLADGQPAAQLGDVVTEYGQIMTGDDGCGGYLVRSPSARIERVYPVADWIADERKQGRFVARRRVIVVEDWIEVDKP